MLENECKRPSVNMAIWKGGEAEEEGKMTGEEKSSVHGEQAELEEEDDNVAALRRGGVSQ